MMPEDFDRIPGKPDEEPSPWPVTSLLALVLVLLAVTAVILLGVLFLHNLLSGS
jgi:hypothetical protein